MKEYDLNQESFRGVEEKVASKLMSTVNSFWGETERNNESGFSAIPGGRRDIWHTYGEFYYRSLGNSANFWTKTEKGTKDTLNRSIVDSSIEKETISKEAGFSVRCITNSTDK